MENMVCGIPYRASKVFLVELRIPFQAMCLLPNALTINMGRWFFCFLYGLTIKL